MVLLVFCFTIDQSKQSDITWLILKPNIIYPIPDNEKYSTFGFYLFSRHPVDNGTRTQ